MATYANLFIDQGSDFSSTIDLSQTSGTLDLTNYTARGQIRKTYASSTKVDFTASLDTTNKKITISLLAGSTSTMKAGRYVYDVEILNNSAPANVTRVLEGQIEVTPRVTQ
tara:strand:+ start:564 stop:896 length:333 start_codon:yes stop_codon:yes gene_type:complete